VHPRKRLRNVLLSKALLLADHVPAITLSLSTGDESVIFRMTSIAVVSALQRRSQ
jgi:hypothetical protein